LLRSERGASAVIVGIVMIPLLGFLAISVDVGALYAEKAQLQNGADAAALSIARNCAVNGLCDAPTTAAAQAQSFANANSNDGTSNVLTPSFPTSSSVRVVASTRETSGASALSHPFARFIGTNSTTVKASATAVWGGPKSGQVFPLALSYCEFLASGFLPTPKLVTIRYDENKTCKKADSTVDIPGGFGWLDQVPGTCQVQVDVAAGTVGSNPGVDPPKNCDSVLAGLKNKTIFIPIFDASSNPGAKGTFHIYAFAAFKVTGWKFGNGSLLNNVDPAAPPCLDDKGKGCTGNARFIQGQFERWVEVDPGFVLGGPTLNGYVVNLTQ
jgi:Flp pilus assembly protein TadG